MKLNLGVLVSGNGSNLQAIIDAIGNGLLAAQIAIVISNNPHAYALVRCKKHGITYITLSHEDFASREAFDREMLSILRQHEVELVVMAGFMRILTPEFIRSFPLRIMNIHPALLPSFPGLEGQRQAFDYGVKFSGCTVHFADEKVDSGPIIIQAVVPVHPTDTVDSLAQRIRAEEHRIYPQAIQWFAEGRLIVTGRKVFLRDGEKRCEGSLVNPPLTLYEKT